MKKNNKNERTLSTQTKEGKLYENNNIDFSTKYKLEFTSFNDKENIIDAFAKYIKDEKIKIL